jgi:YVTN family beta-propeller protein
MSVTVIALDTGKVVGSAPLEGKPERVVASPDGRRLVVLDKGPGKQTARFGYHPKDKSWATVIDAHTMEIVARTELGWTVTTGMVLDGVGVGGLWAFSPDGRHMTISCLGYRSQKPKEALPRELVTLDLESGDVIRRVELERAIDAFMTTPDGATAVVYSAYEKQRKQPAFPVELRFVDLATLEVQNTVSLEGDPGAPTLSPDGSFLYLLEYGKPHKKPDKNINGRIQVVSLTKRSYEVSLDAGSAPRELVVDEEGKQVFVLSDREPLAEKKKEKKRPGILHVVRGNEVKATLEVGENPVFLRIAPDREWLYVVSEETLTPVDLVALRSLRASELDGAGFDWLTSGGSSGGSGDVKELAFSSNGKRGYVLYAGSSKLGILDLEKRTMLAEITTGRGGVKFFKKLGDSRYSVNPALMTNTTLVLSSDEKFLYVLNSHSNDVNIVNTETLQIVNKIGVGGDANRIELLPGGDFVAVRTGKETLHLIDTATNEKVSELPVGGDFVHSPNKKHAVAMAKKTVYCLDGSTLKTMAQIPHFERPIQIVFQPRP